MSSLKQVADRTGRSDGEQWPSARTASSGTAGSGVETRYELESGSAGGEGVVAPRIQTCFITAPAGAIGMS